MNIELIVSAIVVIGTAIGGIIEVRKMRVNFDAENQKRDDLWRDLISKNDVQWQDYARRQLEISDKRLEIAQEELARAERIKEQLTQDITVAQEKRAESDTIADERSKRIEELLVKLELARQDLLTTTREAAQREGEVTQLKLQVSNLDTALKRLQKDVSALTEQNRALSTEKLELQAENRRLLVERNASQEREQQLNIKVEQLEQRLTELEQENETLRRCVEELTEKWKVREQHEQENGSNLLYDHPAMPAGSESGMGADWVDGD